ncbi:hypothetical protein [Actinosynnema sp. NPDC020468]|uniref:hypothetical protein n=1 Tax=Actinosynnema sp. NPDC020468 TaxID=3154488 RepID=UPI0033C73DD5
MVLILLFVFAFVVALLHMGYQLDTALLGAGGAGLVAAEITRRLLDGPEGPSSGRPADTGRLV